MFSDMLFAKMAAEGMHTDLSPFEYASCMMAGAIKAWTTMIVAIDTVMGEKHDPEHIRNMAKDLFEASLEDTLIHVSSLTTEINKHLTDK